MKFYKKIVVAVDGSKEAEYALHKSIEMAKFFDDSILTIVHVIDIFSLAESTVEHEQKTLEVLLNSYKVQAMEQGVKNVEILIEEGSPKNVITEKLAPLANADLITCGATGLKGAEHYFLGSVSEAIVSTAKCDVLVIRNTN